MSLKHYDFLVFEEKHLEGTINLLKRTLWHKDPEKNLQWFKWKYIDNPYRDELVGVVVTYQGSIVGFKGVFAEKWNIGSNNNCKLFYTLSDVCVDEKHRRKGLSSAMTSFIIQKRTNSDVGLIIGLSANYKSMRVAEKIGYVTIYRNDEYVKDSFIAIINYILISKLNLGFLNKEKPVKKHSDIIVSTQPKPKEMSMISNRHSCSGKISIHKNEAFFSWRFNNKVNDYLFYYYLCDNLITDYLVVRKSKVKNNIYIVDYSKTTDHGIKELFSNLVKCNKFSIIRILNQNSNNELASLLDELAFKPSDRALLSRLIKIGNKKLNKSSLLVRPVKLSYNESDWYISGIDTRKIENWNLSYICSDVY